VRTNNPGVEASVPLVIAPTLREERITGVHMHVRQLRPYLEVCGMTPVLIRGRALDMERQLPGRSKASLRHGFQCR
jgi:hypothetical protein